MAQVPDFIRFNCSSNNEPNCATCPREFLIPLNTIEGMYKDKNGKAVVGIKSQHSATNPTCLKRNRYLETSQTWEEAINLLDGAVQNFGDVSFKNEDEIV